jgi:hypothetical protein
VVTRYRLEIETGGTVVRTTDIGKPQPVNNQITVPLDRDGLLRGVPYAVFVVAVGPGGETRSLPSPAATFMWSAPTIPPPAAPTNVTVLVAVTLGHVRLQNTGWVATATSEETINGDGDAAHAIDGVISSLWHTAWTPTEPPPPHTLTVDLGSSQSVTGFTHLPRQDSWPKGDIGRFEFSVSADGVDWGAPVASGLFPLSKAEQVVLFLPKVGRYVRLRAVTERNGNPAVAVAELGVLVTAQ